MRIKWNLLVPVRLLYLCIVRPASICAGLQSKLCFSQSRTLTRSYGSSMYCGDRRARQLSGPRITKAVKGRTGGAVED